MPRARYVPKLYYEVPTDPFTDAEQAWFWFMRCQRAREEGVRFEDVPGSTARPCDPDDIYRAVVELVQRRLIGPEHIRVLGAYGLLERPPDPRRREEVRRARLWDEALDRLTTILRPKGIIE